MGTVPTGDVADETVDIPAMVTAMLILLSF